ncbi:MAG TPA: hypothetical protein VMS31_10740 [Pyrinomonadaceae bacterium]|nr:hypothetical protein [Pyrinomonadaceae bacterium]
MGYAKTEQTWMRRTPLLLLLALLYVPVATGQESPVQDQTAPPPLKIISRVERAQIDESKDAKARVRTTLDLAVVRLIEVEAQTSQQNYPLALAGAGKYWALIEDVFSFLKTMKNDSNKTRDLYKRVELALRAHAPRLSAVRRGTPAEYSFWMKQIEEFARNGRTEALNSFYGHTVFREKPAEQQANKPIPKNSITPDKNQP